MASDAKQGHYDTAVAVDRISSLPGNLIDLILQCLRVHDAARTSILSKIWRDIWGTLPQLVFNDEFFINMVSKYDKQAQLSEASKIIGNILLVHSGPILKFHLSIPEDLPLHQCRDMYLWIKNLSYNGVKELEFFNNTLIAYNMPSYLFLCLELTKLSLTLCVLNPPLRFGGFSNLISVKLTAVSITSDMSFGAQLKQLYLMQCTGIEHLGCQFKCRNNLTVLVIIKSGEINWRWFECTRKLKLLCLRIVDEVYSNEKVINLNKLVGNMPRISALNADGVFLQLLEPGAANLNRPKTSIVNLKDLYLYPIEFCSLHQIQYALCLIQSSPKLRYLQIEVENSQSDTMSVAAVEQYLQLPNFTHMILDKLKTVEILGMVGSRAELHLIKILLASSPCLRWIKLKYKNTHINPEEEVKILRELLPFPRASASAQIIWN